MVPIATSGAPRHPWEALLHPDRPRADSRLTAKQVDCLLLLNYSRGVEELDKPLAMFPSFNFEAAVAYLKLLRRPWL
jgi:hypothetical protein